LWYFLGLAAVQPLVLWLQAAALAVVLNVLRHLPEQQLEWLLGKCSEEPAVADASLAAGRGSSGQLAGGTGERSSSGGWQRDREGYQVFLPLSYDWRARWTWLDWLRFRLLKHSLDIVLVSWLRRHTHQVHTELGRGMFTSLSSCRAAVQAAYAYASTCSSS
jgi:hypothetical protein